LSSAITIGNRAFNSASRSLVALYGGILALLYLGLLGLM
jgi:hypothetical protein